MVPTTALQENRIPGLSKALVSIGHPHLQSVTAICGILSNSKEGITDSVPFAFTENPARVICHSRHTVTPDY